MEKLKRYLVFLVGLFINSLGVSLITKADLFVNPQSYLSSVVYLLIGCVILGFGVYTEVLANDMEDRVRLHKGCL